MSQKEVVVERNPIKRFLANRLLPDQIRAKYDIEPPLSFVQPIPGTKVPPGSGLAYVFSPYQEYYTKLYGVVQIADLTKYRLMYRSQPDVMARINKRILLAVGKGFTVTCDNPDGADAAKFLQKWCETIDLQSKMWFIGIDMVVYGNAFLELVWDQMETTQVELDPNAQRDTANACAVPKRPWVEEKTVCPKCGMQTLYMLRFMDRYTFYGDFKAAAAYKCTNALCGIDELDMLDRNKNELKPYKGTSDEFEGKSVEEIMDTRFEAQIDPRVGQPNQQMPESPQKLTVDVKRKREQPQLDKDTGEEIAPAATVIVNLKGIDPIYMRARADAFGNIFGYYQWLNYPPVLLPSESVIHFKWNEQTWGYETIYGTGLLMPLVRYWDMRTVFENDAAAWFHTFAKPMIHAKGGTPEQPYSNNEMIALSNMLAKQKSGSSVVTKGNVSIDMLGSAVGGRSTTFISDWLNYLNTRFKEILGVPDALMGQSGAGGSNRSTATVGLEDFITETEMLQGKIAKPFEIQVFPAILRQNGYTKQAGYSYHIVFKAVFEEDPNTRSERVLGQRAACVISVNEARKQIPDVKPLEKTDPNYSPDLDNVLLPVPKAQGLPGMGMDGSQGSGLSPTSLTAPQGLGSGSGNVSAEATSNNHRIISSF